MPEQSLVAHSRKIVYAYTEKKNVLQNKYLNELTPFSVIMENVQLTLSNSELNHRFYSIGTFSE